MRVHLPLQDLMPLVSRLLFAASMLLVFAPMVIVSAQPSKTPPSPPGESTPRSEPPSDLEIVLSQDAVTRIAAAATPLTLQGTNTAKVEFPVVGFVEVEANWAAVVSNPKNSFEKDAARFEADAAVSAEPLRYQDKVRGKLDVTYDKKKNRLLVTMKEVAMKLNLRREGVGASIKVDITDQLPLIELPVGLPHPVLKVAKRTVRVELSPKIEYLEGMVKVSSPLGILEPKNASTPH